jgi:Putative peptidoglycan binding domain
VTPQQPDRPDQPPVRGDGASGDGANAGRGETRAAERSAQRAAALAATEGFHPLRIRPYVVEPDGEAGETTVRPPVSAAPGGPATDDLGLFPAMYSGLEYAEDEPDAGYAQAALAAAVRGRHRRRRRGVVIMAAAVAASALAAGAVAVTGQVMGDDQGRTDWALPEQNTSMPDVTLPSDSLTATASAAPAMTREAARGTTSPTTEPAHSPSASPTAPATTPPAPAHSPSASPSGSPSTATTTAPTGTTPPAPPSSHSRAPVPDTELTVGDTGPAVADLQRRLTDVWVYHGPVDGVFDRRVQQAVATFQVWYWVSDAADGSHNGVYGPHTRRVLERQT